MNYKLEKFWNNGFAKKPFIFSAWTINLKSFEIVDAFNEFKNMMKWTINLKSFEIGWNNWEV